MRQRFHRNIVLLMLFLVFFLYRLAFRDDFVFKALVQIVLNSFFDVMIVFLMGHVIDRALLRNFLKGKPLLLKVGVYLSLIAIFYLSVKTLKQLHYFVTNVTVGFSQEFRAVFELESYQIFDTYIVIAFGCAIWLAFRFYENWNREKTWKELAEKERAIAELGFLKAQINPHFIFNTLNNIHFLIDKENITARDAIHDFCELLRYQLYETGHEKVNIRKEIQYIEHYITLQKIRKENGFIIETDIQDDMHFSIAPLLLIVPVENAFKYTGSGAGHYIRISMKTHAGNAFHFKIVNSIGADIIKKGRSESGLGLANLRKRLELFYGSDATLKTENYKDQYEVFITINFKKDENH